ncbi:MAG: shikimate dehydrogenase [Crocinitomicaceae bacterium]|nr:shikimate dehydrogenase [Crocinitomicaceae bacterium]MDG1777664.1 shikimate dehydrogenase [Crocinitomicaceae bacterium]
MKNYGLIGQTLVHSFSKSFFENHFEANQIEAEYHNVELSDIREIDSVLGGTYDGLNVTIPYKESVIPFLDELSDEALAIGAVNTIEFKNGKTIGHNTDAFGFHQSVKPFLSNQHERAIILGTGGASKAVEYILKSLGIDVIFISRNPSRENEFSYEEINSYMLDACKMVVNCTPVGTFPNVNEEISLPYSCLSEHHLIVDLVYNPPKTIFLNEAEQQGAIIVNGYSMLKEQALKSWLIWNL